MTSAAEIRPETPALPARIRPFYWSVRRELWENRSVVIAPLVGAGLVLFGFLVSLARLMPRLREALTAPTEKSAHLVTMPYHFAAFVCMAVMFVVAFFYCLGALNAERRDRSILFWKSLPVSDLVTVASKAFIPLAVLPAVAFVVATAAQLVMLVLQTLALAANGVSPTLLWATLAPVTQPVVLLYGLVTFSLWTAPVYAWLLLVSGWAKRTAILWALGPPLAACIVEKIAFDTSFVFDMIKDRLTGAFTQAFTPNGHPGGIVLSELDPAKFVSSPGLWLGLLAAAGLLYAAALQRRRREPI